MRLPVFLFFIFSFLLSSGVFSQPITLITWNIQHMGQSKDEEAISQIASIVKDADIIAIQEVVAKHPGGAQAVARLVDRLNRMGSNWDYRISDPTHDVSPNKRERYAFIWKTSRVSNIGRFSLVAQLRDICVREPYVGRFRDRKTGADFAIVNYHARVHNESPELEIVHFPKLNEWLATDRIIIAGDFNLRESHSVFDVLYKIGYESAVRDTKTTLKRSCDAGEYLNHPIDNIYFSTRYFNKRKAYAIDFVRSCEGLMEARALSDHLPVLLEFELVD